jgi:hypothetical protein
MSVLGSLFEKHRCSLTLGRFEGALVLAWGKCVAQAKTAGQATKALSSL